MSPNGLVLIPARYGSSRFPGKPLAKISNKTIIQLVFENSKSSGFEVAVVTDDLRIENEVKSFGGNVFRVDDDVASGTERIALCYERFFSDGKFNFIVNVQGDEPLISGELLLKLVKYQIESKVDIATVVRKKSCLDPDFKNPNCVKAIRNEKSGKCLYFTRSSAPHIRESDDIKNSNWFHHMGIYSYTIDALRKFNDSPVSYLENLEKLEQLRALELNLSIGAIETQTDFFGIDTPEDLEKLKGVMGE